MLHHVLKYGFSQGKSELVEAIGEGFAQRFDCLVVDGFTFEDSARSLLRSLRAKVRGGEC